LPWEGIWAAVATALHGSPIGDGQIRAVRQKAAAYIVEALEQGVSVYRLFHERAAEVLAEQHLQATGDGPAAQGAILNALVALVPPLPNQAGRDWSQAPPYLLHHLATHAGKAGRLQELASDPLFLAACDPTRLGPTLLQTANQSGSRPEAKPLWEIADTYKLAAYTLFWCTSQERLAYLELASRQLGYNNLADSWQTRAMERPWEVQWSQFAPKAPHRRFESQFQVCALQTTAYQGAPIVVAGGPGGIEAWEIESGSRADLPFAQQVDSVNHMALGDYKDKTLIATTDIHDSIHVWELNHSAPFFSLPIRHVGCSALMMILPSARNDDDELESCEPAVASGSRDGSVRIWSLIDGHLMGEIPKMQTGISALLPLAIDGSSKFAIGSEDGRIRIWDKNTLMAEGLPLEGHDGPVNVLAYATIENRSVIISGGLDGTIRIWDPIGGHQVMPTLNGIGEGVTALATMVLNHRTLLVSGGYGKVLLVWDLGRTTQIIDRLAGHTHSIHSVVFSQAGSKPKIISGGDDRIIRVWDFANRMPSSRCDEDVRDITSLLACEINGDRIILAGGNDNLLRKWNPCNGASIGFPLEGHTRSITSITALRASPKSFVVTGSNDDTVRIWDLKEGHSITEPFSYYDSPIHSVVAFQFAKSSTVAAGSDNGQIIVWNLDGVCIDVKSLDACSGEIISLSAHQFTDSPLLVCISDNGYVLKFGLCDDCDDLVLYESDELAGRLFSHSVVQVGIAHVVAVLTYMSILFFSLDDGRLIGETSSYGRVGFYCAHATLQMGNAAILAVGSECGYVEFWELTENGLSINHDCKQKIYVGEAIRAMSFLDDSIVIASNAGLMSIKLHFLADYA
jgi:WD40 repeat protein